MSRRGIVTLAAVGVGVLVPPMLGFHPYYLYVFGSALSWATLASGWSLLAFAGQVSFGHAAYFGAGAYTSALLAQRGGLDPWAGVVAAGVAGSLVALPIGLTSGRLSGAYLALATFAYAEACRLVALNWTGLTGGGSGLIGIPPLAVPLAGGAELAPERAGGYYLALGLLVGALTLFASLRRSRVGLAWAAIREREVRAEILGVRAIPYKLLAFACSGAVTAVGGALYAHAVRFLEPDLAFGRMISILPLVMATFGGLRTLLGPAVGALTLYLAAELVLQPTLPRLHQLPYALALIAVVLWLPDGLAGLARRR